MRTGKKNDIEDFLYSFNYGLNLIGKDQEMYLMKQTAAWKNEFILQK